MELLQLSKADLHTHMTYLNKNCAKSETEVCPTAPEERVHSFATTLENNMAARFEAEIKLHSV